MCQVFQDLILYPAFDQPHNTAALWLLAHQLGLEYKTLCKYLQVCLSSVKYCVKVCTAPDVNVLNFPTCTVPDSPSIVSITPGRTSLLVSWTYTNPPLAEGAVISGYCVYLNGSQNGEVTDSSTTQFNITSLSPFTYYSVQVSAYNTGGDAVQQEGPRSEQVITRTLTECK